MIDINQILQWKQEYGEIYQTRILEQDYIFRPIGREEYKEIILMDLELGEYQEAICFQSVIYPDYDFSKGIAGIAEVLSDAILDVSGLLIGQAKQLLEIYRAEMMNYDYQVDCIIHEAFPEYALEEISTWPVRKTMYYLSRAEWILQNLKGVQLIHIDEALQQQIIQEQMQQDQQPPQPYQREIRKELIEHVESEQLKQAPLQQQTSPGDIQSEEQLLAMMAATGAKVSQPSTKFDEVMPELNWFTYMDELTGEFD